MKQKLIAAFAITMLLTGIFPTLGNADQPMHPAIEQLDLDGDMVLFLNTSTLETRMLDYVDSMAAMVQNAMSTSAPNGASAIEQGIGKVKAAIQWSGLLSLEAYAMSMAPAEDGLSRMVSVCQHAETDADKAVWRLLGSEPRELEGMEFVPANAVYTANSTTSLNEAWKIVNEAINEFGGPESAAAFNENIMMAQMLIGTNISAITESIESDILISLQLSEVKTVTISQNMGTNLTFPEPSLLFGLGINDPMLGNIILQKLELAGLPPTKSMHDEYELFTVNLPIPSPVPLSPTLVMTDDYLLIGSTVDVVKEALDCEEDESGLISTPLYKQLLKNAPDEISAVEFLSPRFMKTYLDVLRSAINSTNEPEMEYLLSMMSDSWANLYAGSYALKTPTGFYSESYANYGGVKPIELAASSYVGMLAALVIPSFQNTHVELQHLLISTDGKLTEETIREVSGLREGLDFDALSLVDIEKKLMGVAGIKSVSLERKQPDTLIVKVKERVPVARITGRKISKQPFAIDRHGFVLPPDISQTSLPLILGLDMDLSPGMIESSDVEIALQIIEMCDGSDYLRDYIQIESLDLKGSDFIDMRLAGDIRVRMPRFSLKPKLHKLAAVLKISAAQDRRVKEIDLTLDSAKVPVTYH